MNEKREAPISHEKKQQAYARLRDGKLMEAKDLFAEVCHLAPDDAEAWFMQGTLAGQLDLAAAAQTCFRQAAKLQPDRPEIHFNLGKTLEAQGRQGEAFERYREALRLKADFYAAAAQIANLLLDTGRVEEALAGQREAVRLAPGLAEAHYNLGNILKETGRYAEAEAAYREALKRNPAFAEAWHNVGVVLTEQDRPDEAEAAYREALKLNPALAAVHHSLGNLLYLQGRWPEAEAAYREAVRLKPDYEEALNNLGTVLVQRQRLDEAAQYYQAALDQRPNAFSHCSLGNLCLRQQRLEEAVGHYREALALAPDYPEAYNNLGNTLRQMGRGGEAQAAYEQALTLDPEYADAWANLGTVLMESGRLDEALTGYRRAAELDPGSSRAVAGQAGVLERQGRFEEAYGLLRPFLDAGETSVDVALVFAALSRPLGRGDQAIALMERLLADDGFAVEVHDRTLLHFTLGRLLDEAGEYDRAFAHYQQGNTLAKRRFDVKGHVGRTDALIAAYSPPFMAQAPRATHRSQRPVFIVGMPRSGTSLVEQILASHPAVFGAGELETIGQIVMDLPGVLGAQAPYPQCLTGLTAARVDELAQRYLDHVATLAPGDAARITDKMPINFLHLGLIALLFPEARIIHCVRDPLDTCLSCYFQHFADGQPYTYNLAHLGAFYRQYQRLMDHWRSVLDVPMLEVRYEDLVGHQETTTRRMVEFCGLEWDVRCLRFHESSRAIATASYDQVRQPLYGRSVGRWRHYAAHLEPLRRALTEPSPWEATAAEGSSGSDPQAARAKKDEAYAQFTQGNLLEARQLYAEACHLDPDDAEAHYNLGTIAKDMGEYEAAETAYREALRLRPDSFVLLHNLGTVLSELSRFEEAARFYEAAIAQKPNPLSHSNLGNIYTGQQRYEEAIEQYRQALAFDPNRFEIYVNLGISLMQTGQFTEAEAAYREGLKLRPDSADAYTKLAGALVNQRRLEEARTCYRRALEIAPDLRQAALGEAGVLEKQGQFEQSYELLRPFLDADDTDVQVALALAGVCRPLKRCDEAISRLERSLAARGDALEIYHRITAHFTLGRLLDAAGEYERSFSHYRQGNALVNLSFDPRHHEKQISAIIETYSPELLAQAPRAAHGSERPVFIVGMPRSGTSLVEQILSSHPAVFGAGELGEITQIATDLVAPQYLSQDQCERHAERYLDYIGDVAGPDVRRVTDKMPANFQYLGIISLLFPRARIIHCVRDPLDTCLSCFFQRFAQGQAYSYNLAHLGAYYRQYRRLMDHWNAVLDLPMMEVRYEELVADQEEISRRLVAFCGLEWDDRCLRFHESPRAVKTASYDQVRQPIYQRSVGRWRHYERHLAPLKQALASEPRQ